jgi:heptosyltransferase II
MNLAIFLPNWLGDLVMATPTLRAIRQHYGRSARIVGIIRPDLADLLAGTDWLDEQWQFDARSPHAEWRRLALIVRMRRERIDKIVLLKTSFHAALLAWLGGSRERIGYARNGRGLLLTTKLDPLREAGHIKPFPAVHSYLALAEAAGCPAGSPRLELAVTESERRLGARIWRALGLRDDRVVAMHVHAAYGPAKTWPVEHAAALARQVAEHLGHDVLVFCGPRERDAAREIARRAACRRVFSLADQPLGLPATKACLARCRAMISTDSGPGHVAAALGIPVVTLMGPTLPVWIENPTVTRRIVRVPLDCLGCGRRSCPLGHHRCMQDLLPEQVLGEVAGVLEKEAVRAA